MHHELTFQTDLSWLFLLLGAAAVVLMVLLFRTAWRRNAQFAVSVAAALAAGIAAVVIMNVRTAEVATARREHANDQLKALQQELAEMEARQQARAVRLETPQPDDRLPDDKAGRQSAPAAETPTELSAAWLPEVDEQFEADIYPSAKLASQALVREWESHFDKLKVKGIDTPKLIRISSRSRARDVDTLELLEAMNDLLKKKFPKAGTLVTTRPEAQEDSEPKAGEITITLTVSQSVRRNRSRTSAEGPGDNVEVSGVLLAAFNAPTWQFGVSSRFVEKPWLTATSEFLSLRHGTTYLIVRSNQLASSAEEATRDVLGQTANRLGHLIDPRENQGLPRAASAIMLEQLETGKYIADRFVQSLKRPYGNVYREALLIDIGNANLRDMILVALDEAREHQSVTEQRSAERLSGAVGLLIVIAALTALYLLLNWLTKGYYRGPLAVTVCLLGSGAIVGTVLLLRSVV